MSDGPRPYAAMEDSGLPWSWEVPQHWIVQPIGRIEALKPIPPSRITAPL